MQCQNIVPSHNNAMSKCSQNKVQYICLDLRSTIVLIDNLPEALYMLSSVILDFLSSSLVMTKISFLLATGTSQASTRRR